MRNQEAGSKHFSVCQLSWLESERSLSYAGNLAAVENVQAKSFGRLSLLLLRTGDG